MTASHLYLVEFVGLGVKVGISAQPLRRLQQHHRDAAAFGHTVGRTWVSPLAHVEAPANERAIKGESRREYLRRPFDECLRQALALPMTEPPAAEGRSPMLAFLGAWIPAFGDFLDREEAAL